MFFLLCFSPGVAKRGMTGVLSVDAASISGRVG